MLVKTEGVVIKSIDYGETNKIITLFTKTHGKVSVLAKGAKKPKSRFHAVTQMFSYGQYVFFLGKEMGNLNHGEMEFSFKEIKQDIEKTAYAAYMAELLDKMTEPKETNSFLFEQLIAGLEQINEGKDEEMVAMLFEMKLLQVAGYQPHLQSCTICGNIENLDYFHIRHGGLVCDRHQKEQAIYLQPGTIKVLKMFEQINMRRLGNIKVREATKSQLRFVMRSFFDEYIGISLKTRNFLDQMKNFNL